MSIPFHPTYGGIHALSGEPECLAGGYRYAPQATVPKSGSPISVDRLRRLRPRLGVLNERDDMERRAVVGVVAGGGVEGADGGRTRFPSLGQAPSKMVGRVPRLPRYSQCTANFIFLAWRQHDRIFAPAAVAGPPSAATPMLEQQILFGSTPGIRRTSLPAATGEQIASAV
jgi:hypothetical protein